MEHICLLESEIVAHDEYLQAQATSLDTPLWHEHDLVVQDLKNHKSIFAPVRHLLNDVLLHIFQFSIDASVKVDVKTTHWILSYICHHWRALSHSSPSLWTNILVIPCSSSVPSGRHHLYTHLLSLSGDLPLKINMRMICLPSIGMSHRQICSGDDRDIVWEDITLHSHQWSHINLIINELVPALQNSSSLTFVGVARAVPLFQLVRLVVCVLMYKLDDVSPDIYACMMEATMLEELCFYISRWENRQPSAESNAQLLPTFIHNSIKALVLDSGSLSILDQCSIPNLKELSIGSRHTKNFLSVSEVESTDPGVEYLLRFVERSECNVQTFVSSLSMLLSTFKSLWTQWSLSLTKLTITVTSATRVDAVQELTFEDSKPGILPKLQHLILRMPKGMSIFQDGSLLQMVSSWLTCPGSFRMLAIETRLTGEHVLSQDIITQMNRLCEMRAVGVCAEFRVFLAKDREYLDYFETDEHFAKFLKELEKGIAL
ncbi:hypothetical protein ARMSODRAFT_1025403 [Armillaria solidipes]|uniref:F-box domain-containing protein n=1 Tax=Armillaria solidipes TaxID=1076256 RepID=A0A2H3BDF8_9AGAR|nr:hypothetical protein ARMSODRAFT_1025403 [Armillaria solidipes]